MRNEFNVGDFVVVGTAYRAGPDCRPGTGSRVADEYTGTRWYVAGGGPGKYGTFYDLARTMDDALAGDSDVNISASRLCRAECPGDCGRACTVIYFDDGARPGLCDKCAAERPETDDGWRDDKSAHDY